MKQPEVFKKIGGIIKELQEQYDYLQSNAENLNDLELELFVANTHFLKDHAEILRKLNLLKQAQQPELPLFTEKSIPAPVSQEKKSIANEPKYFEPVVQQKVVERTPTPLKPEITKPEQIEPIPFELVSPVTEKPAPTIDLGTTGDSYAFERETEPETVRHELIMDEAETWEEDEDAFEVENENLNIDSEEQNSVPEPFIEPEEQVTEAEEPILTNPEPVVENQPKTEAAPEQEPAKDEKPLSLNQRMAAQLKDKRSFAAEAAQPAETPIADIKAAISLNDKMMFIKELFNGYPLSYSEAIEIVNRFKSFEEADRFLRANYITKNNWEAKTTAFEKFYALLKRRYA